MIADKLTHIHLPRTGGTSIRCHLRWLERAGRLNIDQDWGERAARSLPRSSRYVFAVIRNPFDWYVSRYHWFVKLKDELAPSGQFDRGADDGIFGRKTPITFAEWLTQGFARDDERYPVYWGEPFEDGYRPRPYFGMYIMVRDMFCNAAGSMLADRLVRLENVKDDMRLVYGEAGVDASDVNFPPDRYKKTKHGAVSDYYTPVLRSLVVKHDYILLNKYGYEL